jgi:hypothetical protein
VVLKNVPLWTSGDPGHVENGAGVQKYIAGIERATTNYSSGAVTQKSELASVDWNASNTRISLTFRALRDT